MPNSASQLAALLESWQVASGATPEQSRGLRGGQELSFWRKQAMAVALLRDVERTLAGMEALGNDISPFQRALPRWYEAVFSYTVPWRDGGKNGPRPAIAEDPLYFLKALGGQIDAMGLGVELSENVTRTLMSTLAEAEDLAREDTGLSPSLRRYVLALIKEARNAVEEIELFGTSALRSISAELGGAILAAANESTSEDRRSAWTKILKDVLLPLGITVAGQIAGTALQNQLGM
ncbi:hypothetical protein [Actinocatenispora rupis]|uniref:Uncharacterized protein n=1 Tax=Actinocatenispora rupis TaxID=519421 RepID=A0A8J3NEC5_9ACTN|nr:hypothetical protein [Actinocatenispora rupis]GID13820.1 hypothetical protein Aru02nite_47090 [Actinocatenispora rupis]